MCTQTRVYISAPQFAIGNTVLYNDPNCDIMIIHVYIIIYARDFFSSQYSLLFLFCAIGHREMNDARDKTYGTSVSSAKSSHLYIIMLDAP